jgi:Zn-dependent protease with chaperone function
MPKRLETNVYSRFCCYSLWFAFYIIFFGVPFSFLITVPLYSIIFWFSFSPLAESLWRVVMGVRLVRIRAEKDRLYPLRDEVFDKVFVGDNIERLKGIHLYIQETMDINAFSFGKNTLVFTRGSLELLNDNCLKGLMAHEYGHFVNEDTRTYLITKIGNLPMSLTLKYLSKMKKKLDKKAKKSLVLGLFKTLVDAIYYVFKFIAFLADLIIMHLRRKGEYRADAFAHEYGYGAELTEALNTMYRVSITKPKKVKEQMTSEHPAITKRIEKLEGMIYLDEFRERLRRNG